MNIQLVLEKSLDSLNVQWTSKLFHGKITYFPKCSMKIQIVSWTNHLIPSLFNEHTNCLMGKPLDSQHVQWTSKLFHGQTSWFPTCSMNMQIVMEKSLDSLNVQWSSKLFDEQSTYFPKFPMKIQIVWTNHRISWMINEHSHCLMEKSLTFLHAQWKSKLLDGQNSWFPKCSMNIQIVSWTNLLIP